jgi:hypothetical protein
MTPADIDEAIRRSLIFRRLGTQDRERLGAVVVRVMAALGRSAAPREVTHALRRLVGHCS